MLRIPRRPLLAALIVVLLAAPLIPLTVTADAAPPGQGSGPAVTPPQTITGSYAVTNPLFATIGADPGIILFDLAGLIADDYDFEPALASQVLGEIDGDIMTGSYSLELPAAPQGEPQDFDGDAATPPVQVFAPATYINLLGDVYIGEGEGPFNLSIAFDPLSREVVGGYMVVWAAGEGAVFPAGFGADGNLFTADDPLQALPTGWSVIALDDDPFGVIRQPEVTVPVTEQRELKDYSELSYDEAWNRLFDRVKVTYPFAEQKRINWDSLYNFIDPMVQQVGTDVEFHFVMARFGSLIPDTHVSFVSTPLVASMLVGGVGLGKLAVTDAGEVLVTQVQPELPADRAGIDVGDEIITVDGVPALQALDETPLLYRSASTLHSRRFMQSSTVLQGRMGTDLALTWRNPDGTEESAVLTREFDVLWSFAELNMRHPGDDVVYYDLLESGLGYISVRSFAENVDEADALFGAALQSLMDAGARGIIIDMRNNPGGFGLLSMAMAGRFFAQDVPLFDYYYADGSGEFVYRGTGEVLSRAPYYDGPVAVLVDELTASAGDYFAYALAQNDRALIVGHTPTNGAAGEIGDGQYKLPGDLEMSIPTGRPIDPATGKILLEGRGVVPDVRVPVTRDSVLSPDDEVLRAAEDALLQQIAAQPGE